MARSRNIGNVYAELSVKDKMTAGMKRAEKALASLGGKLASFGKGVALASMKSAIDAGGQLSDMMARTGAGGEGLFVMQRAFENAGIAGDKVPGVLNKMQKALSGVNEAGQQVMSRVFDDLGLSLDELRGMDATGAFRRISESIAAIPDPAKQAAVAMEIFATGCCGHGDFRKIRRRIAGRNERRKGLPKCSNAGWWTWKDAI